MAKPTIVTRAGKGSALTWTEGDSNLTNLRDATITVKAGTGGTDVISDLNGTVTLVAGTNVTLSGDNTAKSVTINASTPTLNLDDLADVNTSGVSNGQVLYYDGGTSQWSTITLSSGGLENVVEDTTPQLGGNLDVNGNQIVSTSNGDIVITPNGTGVITLAGLDWPTAPAGAGGFTGNVTSVDGSTERLNITNAVNISLGDQITFAGGDVPDSGLSTSATYFVVTANDIDGYIQVSETSGGSAKDLTTVSMPGDFTWSTGGAAGSFSGGEVLTYSNTAGGLVWAAPSGGGGGTVNLGSLGDVNITGLSNGQILVYDSMSTKWINTSPSSGGLENIVEDTTPQLGGNLDVNGNSIVSTSNGNIVLAPNGTGIVRADKSLQIQDAGEIRLADSDSSNYVGFKAPTTVSTNRIWTLPSADGTNGQVLTTNGSGTLSWASAGSGGNGIIHLTLPNNLSLGTVQNANLSGSGQLFTLRSSGGISGVSVNEFNLGNFTLPAGTYMLKMPTMSTQASPKGNIIFYNQTDNSQVVSFNFITITIGGVSNCGFWAQPSVVFTISSSKRFTFQNSTTTAFSAFSDYSNNLFQFEIHKLS